MQLFVDLDKNKIVRSPGSGLLLNRLDFKRGSTVDVEVIFYSNSVVTALPSGASGFLGMKAAGEFDGELVVSDDAWAVVDEGGDVSYVFNLDFNTVPLNILLGHDGAGGDVSNDIPFVDLMFELRWVVGGAVSISQTLTARVTNNVIKSGEGLPSSGTPVYPSAGDINAAIADIDAIEARDWVRVPDSSIDGNQGPGAWQDGVVSVMIQISEVGYPTSAGTVRVDRRSDISRRSYVDGDRVYTSSTGRGGWTEWKQQATTDEVVDLTTAQTVAGGKTFTNELRATGQTAVDGSSVMTRELSDNRYGESFRVAKTDFTTRTYNASLVTDDDLNFPVVPVGWYKFKIFSVLGLTVNPSSFRWELGGTAILQTNAYFRGSVIYVTNITLANPLQGGTTIPQFGGGSTSPLIIEGFIHVTTEGSISFDWASDTVGQTATLAYGYMELDRTN